MSASRTLAIVGVAIAVFAAAFTAGRALRPAGAPAAVRGTKALVVPAAAISAGRFDADGLPPLVRPPRADRPADRREGDRPRAVPPAGERPSPDPPAEPVEPGGAPPPPTPPQSRAQPAPPQPQPAPEPQGDPGGGWSSGN